LQRISVPTWRSVIHPDDVEDAESRLRRAFETGADFEQDFRLLTPLGEVRWVAVRSVPFSVTDERSVGRLGTMENVSEHHVAQDALQRSEELHRSVIEGMSEGIYVQAADGRLIESNAAARRLAGNASGDLRDVVVVHEDGTGLLQRQLPANVALRTGAYCSNVIVGVQDPVRGSGG
jgi:PAS domain-containing protein